MAEQEAIFTDKYGEQRVIHKAPNGWQAKREKLTPALLLNRSIAGLIGRRVRALRRSRSMTLAELCLAAGLVSATPKSRMWEIENAVRPDGIRLGTLYALAIALGVEATELLAPVADVLALTPIEKAEVERLLFVTTCPHQKPEG